MELEPILRWKMNPEEATAYKLCLLWMDTLRQECPDEYHTRFATKTDPRKSLLFRYCYKLQKETKGLVPEEEYPLYILAQVQMLKSFTDGTVHALIEPACLCGEKAWWRWKKWKTKFNKNYQQAPTFIAKTNKTDIEIALDKTKQFLISKLGENYSHEQITKIMVSKDIVKYAAFGKISSYYLVLSPLIPEYFKEIDDTFTIQQEVLQPSITPEIKKYFREIFAEEF